MNRLILLLVILSFIGLSTVAGGTPFSVDLKRVVNTDIEDDGVADNEKGGWSDEGINDMYIYPPVKFGKVTQYGYTFEVIDPKENDGKSVIMLKGGVRGQDKPESVSVKVPNVKGKYLYLLLNAVGRSKDQPKNYVAATCTVKYADGSKNVIELRDGIELRHQAPARVARTHREGGHHSGERRAKPVEGIHQDFCSRRGEPHENRRWLTSSECVDIAAEAREMSEDQCTRK